MLSLKSSRLKKIGRLGRLLILSFLGSFLAGVSLLWLGVGSGQNLIVPNRTQRFIMNPADKMP